MCDKEQNFQHLFSLPCDHQCHQPQILYSKECNLARITSNDIELKLVISCVTEKFALRNFDIEETSLSTTSVHFLWRVKISEKCINIELILSWGVCLSGTVEARCHVLCWNNALRKIFIVCGVKVSTNKCMKIGAARMVRHIKFNTTQEIPIYILAALPLRFSRKFFHLTSNASV